MLFAKRALPPFVCPPCVRRGWLRSFSSRSHFTFHFISLPPCVGLVASVCVLSLGRRVCCASRSPSWHSISCSLSTQCRITNQLNAIRLSISAKLFSPISFYPLPSPSSPVSLRPVLLQHKPHNTRIEPIKKTTNTKLQPAQLFFIIVFLLLFSFFFYFILLFVALFRPFTTTTTTTTSSNSSLPFLVAAHPKQQQQKNKTTHNLSHSLVCPRPSRLFPFIGPGPVGGHYPLIHTHNPNSSTGNRIVLISSCVSS